MELLHNYIQREMQAAGPQWQVRHAHACTPRKDDIPKSCSRKLAMTSYGDNNSVAAPTPTTMVNAHGKIATLQQHHNIIAGTPPP